MKDAINVMHSKFRFARKSHKSNLENIQLNVNQDMTNCHVQIKEVIYVMRSKISICTKLLKVKSM